MKIEYSEQVFEKYSNIKFHEYPSSGSRVVSVRTDRRTDMTKLIVTSRNFAKAPENWWINAMEQCRSWKVASHQLVKSSLLILEFWGLLRPAREPGTVLYPIPRHINPTESPTLLLRTHPYVVLPVCSLLFRYYYQYYYAVFVSQKLLCGTNALCTLPILTQLVSYFSKRRPGFNARPMQVGFMAHKMALPEAFFSAPRFSSESKFPETIHTYPYTYPRDSIILAICTVFK
jgi:hypothetical protein